MSSTPTYIQQRCTCQYAALCILRIPVSRWNGSRLTVGQRVSALLKELYCSFSTYISRCKLLESHNLWCARNIMKSCNLVCFVMIRSFCHTLLFVSGLGTIPLMVWVILYCNYHWIGTMILSTYDWIYYIAAKSWICLIACMSALDFSWDLICPWFLYACWWLLLAYLESNLSLYARQFIFCPIHFQQLHFTT